MVKGLFAFEVSEIEVPSAIIGDFMDIFDEDLLLNHICEQEA